MFEVYLILFGCLIFWPALSIVIRIIINFKSQIKQNWSYLLLGFFMLSSVLVYVFNFGIDLTNRNASDWNSVATYFNNLFSPALLLVTIFLLHRTWKTSKEELAETRNELKLTRELVTQQSELDENSFLLEHFKDTLDRVVDSLDKETSAFVEDVALNKISVFLIQQSKLNDKFKNTRIYSNPNLYTLFEDGIPTPSTITEKLINHSMVDINLAISILYDTKTTILKPEEFAKIESPTLIQLLGLYNYYMYHSFIRFGSYELFNQVEELQNILSKVYKTKFQFVFDSELNARLGRTLYMRIRSSLYEYKGTGPFPDLNF